ncbi:hypothetical protein CANCADRAFT_128386 [Tortispora caseinolytica NRRL Y-17796]|uniref:Nucleolar GTP-binding protein 1 n=1 Tax=Tortispora caseinolytica NRRL Y-17796 TaxID=767744 RepID=A0A1E4TAH4_9ASCO|nr:hypothetical protein CANCADRAFT_128386 [Tortispora caseinolytica NRRL Y-17796]
MKTAWKDIAPIPNSNDFLDVVLNRTQRKTPTVIRPGYSISRIRAFYMRKVRFTADGFAEKLQEIVDSFPRLDDIHPFHRDLMHTLYEKNHYKIALSQMTTSKSLIESVSRDYVRLLKYGQSLFQCKQLKRAALGRMATIIKRLKDPLIYLEQVRQHLGRLPSIDPNTRTLIICGYPNVGKSSFLRSITRADVEVQPYAFTTKSLYVGHFDYKYLRFQAIDTPGILDHPTDEMNTIEMQSIYAIAHIRSCCLYFMDLSEQCGYSVEAQVKLFHNIKPLFSNKSVLVVINKTDILRLEELDEERTKMVNSLTEVEGVEIMQLSCQSQDGLFDVRNRACEKLLSQRIEQKLKGTKVNNVLNKIHLATPQPRDDKVREHYIPEGALELLHSYDKSNEQRRKLARDIEEENGGAGVFSVNLKDKYILEDEEWKNDIMPEILDGKNVYDFIDPQISAKLKALEEEEERLEQEGFYESEEEIEDDEAEEIRRKAAWIRKKHKIMKAEGRIRKGLNNNALIPRSKKVRTLSQFVSHMEDIGVDPSATVDRAAKSRPGVPAETGQDIVMRESEAHDAHVIQSNRLEDGVSSKEAVERLHKAAKKAQRLRNRMARVGEADRHTPDTLPKHLFSGKRGIGKNQRR